MHNTQQVKALFITEHGQHEARNISHVPRVGDHVDMFYNPTPEVVKVLWWPKKEDLGFEVDVAIILR